ncbi:MAG: tetratricopeptide repeat protein [Pseudomonadota bacterium]
MDNSIFHEVEEDLQREKLMKLWRDYGMYTIAIVVAVIMGTGATLYWRNARYENRTTQSKSLSQAVALADKNQLPQALAALKKLSEQKGEYAHLADFQRAGLIVQYNSQKKAGAPPLAEAIAIYDNLAKSRKVDSKTRNLALLLSVLLQLDTGDPKALTLRLQKASGSANPWAALALEAQAILAIREGKPEQAKAILKSLKQKQFPPQNVILRLEAVLSGP